MDRYDISYASEHLPELIERAARGETVTITDGTHGAFQLYPVSEAVAGTARKRPIPGQWKGRLTEPARLMEPLSEEELAWLSGENSE